MVEQLEEFPDFCFQVALYIFRVDQSRKPAHSDQTIGAVGAVYPAKGGVGSAVNFSFLHCF